jgi:hypothetical protein
VVCQGREVGDRDERTRPDAALAAAVVVAGLTALSVVRVGVDGARRKLVMLMPDLWETQLAAQAAGQGRQLVGAWSRLGLFHPGPAWFWWAAPFVRLCGGHPAGLALAAAALAATALVVAFAAARTATDGIGALVVAATLALGVGQLSTRGLAAPWNPTIVILPVTAGLVCVAVVAIRGRTWPAVAGILLGTLVAQAHLGTLVLGLAIVVGSLVAWRLGGGGEAPTPPRGHASALLLAVVLPWVPVVVDQIVGEQNAVAVARYVATGDVDHRYPLEPTGPALDLSIPAAVRQLGSVATLVQGDTALWAGVDVQSGEEHAPSGASTLALLALVAVAVAAARPDRWRRGSTDALGSWICRVGLAALTIELVATEHVRHEFRPYLIASAAGVGLALWVGVALVALHAVRTASWTRSLVASRRVVLRRVGTVALALGSLVAIAGQPARFVGYAFEAPGDAATRDRVATALDGEGAVVRVPTIAALRPALALTAELEREGTPLAVRGRFRAHFSDLQRQASADDATLDLWVVPPGTQAPDSCTDLGRFQGAEVCTTARS